MRAHLPTPGRCSSPLLEPRVLQQGHSAAVGGRHDRFRDFPNHNVQLVYRKAPQLRHPIRYRIHAQRFIDTLGPSQMAAHNDLGPSIEEGGDRWKAGGNPEVVGHLPVGQGDIQVGPHEHG